MEIVSGAFPINFNDLLQDVKMKPSLTQYKHVVYFVFKQFDHIGLDAPILFVCACSWLILN